MGEEVLVLGGENCIADNGRNVPILQNLAVLRCQLNQWLSVGVVDMSNGRKLITDERPDVRQIGPVEVDIMKSHENNKSNNHDNDADRTDYRPGRPS